MIFRSLVPHVTLLRFFSLTSVSALKISTSWDPFPVATVIWDTGDPPTVTLSLLNKLENTLVEIAEINPTITAVPLPSDVTGNFVLEASALDPNTGSNSIITQSPISVPQNNTSNRVNTNSTTSTAISTSSSSSDDSQSSSSTTFSTPSQTPPQFADVPSTSTTIVQPTVVSTSSSTSANSAPSTSSASTSIGPTANIINSSSDTFEPTIIPEPTASPLTDTISNPITVPAVIGIVVAVSATLLTILLFVRWYLRRSRKGSGLKRRQRKNAKRISPFVYNRLRPKSRRQTEDLEGGFDTDAFVGHSRNNSEVGDKEMGHGYDGKSVLQRSASVISLVSGKTCTTYTAEISESDYENRVSLPTLRGDVVSVTSNFGSTDSQFSVKTPKDVTSRATTNADEPRTSHQPDEIRESLEPEIGWLQDEMRRFIDADNREAGWALEGFQEPIPDEHPPAYNAC